MNPNTAELNLNEMEMASGGGTKAALICGAVGVVFGGWAGAQVGCLAGPVGIIPGAIIGAVIGGGGLATIGAVGGQADKH